MPPRRAHWPRASTSAVRSYPASTRRATSSVGSTRMSGVISRTFCKKRSRGIWRHKSVSALITIAFASPVAAAPSASRRRMVSSRLDAAVRTKDMSRAGKSAAPPPSRALRSSRTRWAATSLEVTNKSGLPSLRAAATVRCSFCASSSPQASAAPGRERASVRAPNSLVASSGAKRQLRSSYIRQSPARAAPGGTGGRTAARSRSRRGSRPPARRGTRPWSCPWAAWREGGR